MVKAVCPRPSARHSSSEQLACLGYLTVALARTKDGAVNRALPRQNAFLLLKTGQRRKRESEASLLFCRFRVSFLVVAVLGADDDLGI